MSFGVECPILIMERIKVVQPTICPVAGVWLMIIGKVQKYANQIH